MHKRDLIVRQIEEFGKFLALLLNLKNDNQFKEIPKALEEGTLKHIGLQLSDIECVVDNDLINTLTLTYQLSDEKIKMLADIFYEKGINECELNNNENATPYFSKAKLLYEFVNQNATLPYSLDTHYKLEAIKTLLN